MPGTCGAITGATDAVPVLSSGTATEVGPLTSSPPGRGKSWGGALWTPAYTMAMVKPVGCTPITLYCSSMYINCYVTVNKPELSYLSVHLLPHCFIQ
jgi:hypothetical protein